MSTDARKKAQGQSFPIERHNLGTDVYRVLRDRIFRREFRAGEKLSDLRLSSELGVSRTPIREALLQLVQDGLVVAEPNRGFFVATFSRKDLEEIYDLRAALETFVLRQASQTDHRKDYEHALFQLEHVERLTKFAVTEKQREEAVEAFLRTDRGFHSWLVETSGNERLVSIITGLWAQVSIFQHAVAEIPGWMEIAIDQHREIIRCLLNDDVHGAVRALENHIQDMKVRVLEDLTPLESDSGEGAGAPE